MNLVLNLGNYAVSIVHNCTDLNLSDVTLICREIYIKLDTYLVSKCKKGVRINEYYNLLYNILILLVACLHAYFASGFGISRGISIFPYTIVHTIFSYLLFIY